MTLNQQHSQKFSSQRFQLRAAGLAGLLLSLLALASEAGFCRAVTNPDLVTGRTDSFDIRTNGLGSWIWTSKTFDRQTCQFWREFEIPRDAAVRSARIRMTADNEHTLFFDGREMGRGAEWRNLCQYDLTMLMTPGRHVLAVTAFNSTESAGLLFGMHVDLADGRVVQVKSDANWRIVPEGARGWEKMTEAPDSWQPATVVAAFGSKPWTLTPENIEIIPPAQPIKTYFWQSSVFQITLLAACGLVILISIGLIAQLALHRQERWLLQQERSRIARDIHDDLGSRMTQLVLRGEVAQSELPDESVMRAELQGICEQARGLLSTMDEILWAVNPRRDTLRDFTSYVCSYAQEFFRHTSIQCLFDVDSEMSAAPLALPLRRSLLMAIKETLNNTLKHSGATTVKLEIRWQRQKLVVVVSDNGEGFDCSSAKTERNGLTNMSQRMKELGGSCAIISQPGEGCRVEFGIPLSRWRRRPWDWIWKTKTVSAPMKSSENSPADNVAHIHEPTNC
jgi:signal transduction histidine kinase